ncbi:hypothetical protein [uncultured Thiodictyon sp.]|uniref:hypothetical protein n=1 Tax=uncultured Thiodictyon sp. TaxID=1846217 RepID=UPI0025D945AD|nr:hypothetical protein [uncultured Thiodictyon sp.]
MTISADRLPQETQNTSGYPSILIITALVAITPSLWWILLDQTAWPWDQAWYGEVSADLWSTLTWRTADWPSEMLSAQSPKAPGLAWLGQFFVPLGELLGSVELGLMLLILLLQCGSLLLMGSLGRALAPRSVWVPLAGVLAMASAPLFIAMSQQFLTEAFQCFAITYFYWIGARSQQRHPFETLTHLVLATGLAVAAKTTSPLYFFLPACLALGNAIVALYGPPSPASKPRPSRTVLIVGAAGTAFLLAIAAWYLVNFTAVWDFVKLASTGDAALDYGHRSAFIPKLEFWTRQTTISLATQWTSWIIIAIILAGAIARFDRSHATPNESRNRDLLALAALAHIMLVLFLFSFQINEETRYLLPLLPAVAVLLMWSLTQPPLSKPGAAPVAFFVLAAQWGLVHARAHDLIAPTPTINAWVKPYDSDSENRIEIENLVNLTSTKQTHRRYNICGVELPWLNANTLAFFAAKQEARLGFRAMYTSLGYATKDITMAWSRLNSLNINYYISITADKQPTANFINEASLPVLMRITEDPRFSQVLFPSRRHIIVYQKQ